MEPTTTTPTAAEIPGLLTAIARIIVTEPAAVQATVLPDPAAERLTVQLRCAPADTGRLIGKQGRTIQALRAFARVLGGRAGQRVYVQVAAPPAPAG